MHDASITITKSWIFGYLSFLFLLPILFFFICNVFKIKKIGKELFLLYVTSVTSISSLFLSINQPCNFINGGYFMFIDSSLILFYYLSKLALIIIYLYLVTVILMLIRISYKKNKK
jgi:hypothetical protein